MKIKVLGFVLLLMLFLGCITYLEIRRFGSLTGYFSSENNQETASGGTYAVAFGELFFFIVVFIFVSLTIKLLFNYHLKKEEESDKNIHYSNRILIPVDLSSPKEE